jgi:hypothetical protein
MSRSFPFIPLLGTIEGFPLVLFGLDPLPSRDESLVRPSRGREATIANCIAVMIMVAQRVMFVPLMFCCRRLRANPFFLHDEAALPDFNACVN